MTCPCCPETLILSGLGNPGCLTWCIHFLTTLKNLPKVAVSRSWWNLRSEARPLWLLQCRALPRPGAVPTFLTASSSCCLFSLAA